MVKYKIKKLRKKNRKSSLKIFFYNEIFISKYTFYVKITLVIILAVLYILLIKSQLNIKKNYKRESLRVCLCAVGKKENLYAKEYVNHYMKLGYSHIYLYDNNDINGEKFEDVLQEEIKSNFVSILNYRGVIGPQLQVYEDCYEKNNKNYEWLSFFDLDEFLDIKPYANNIQEFLSNKRYENCTTLKINFLFYSDNELLHYDNRPLQERFTAALPEHGSNSVIKSTVRGGLYPNYWSLKFNSHTSLFKCNSCNSYGEKVDYKAMNFAPALKYARLKHYYT